MLSRPTQWTRIGIVLSIVWALFVLAWGPVTSAPQAVWSTASTLTALHRLKTT